MGMTWLARGSAKVEQRRSSPCKSLINKEHGQPTRARHIQKGGIHIISDVTEESSWRWCLLIEEEVSGSGFEDRYRT